MAELSPIFLGASPIAGAVTTAQGNTVVRFNVNPYDWQTIYDAGLGQGSQFVACGGGQGAQNIPVSQRFECPNVLGVASSITFRNTQQVTMLRGGDAVRGTGWKTHPKQTTLITDEWIDLDDMLMRDNHTIVTTSSNVVDNNGIPDSNSGFGCNFRWFAFAGVEYVSSKQAIPREKPADALIEPWKAAFIQRRHVRKAVAGDYTWSDIMRNHDYPSDDAYNRAWGLHPDIPVYASSPALEGMISA